MLAGSAFVALVDIFLVSIVALTGGSVDFGLSSLAMAAVGLVATRRLIPRAKPGPGRGAVHHGNQTGPELMS